MANGLQNGTTRLWITAVAATAGLTGLAAAGLAPWWATIGAAAALLAALVWIGQGHLGDIAAYKRHIDDRTDTDLLINDPPLGFRLVEGIRNPLLLTDPNNRVVLANAAARTLLGERVVGRDVAMHLRHPQALDAIRSSAKDDRPYAVEISLLSPTERTYTLSAMRVTSRQTSDGQGDDQGGQAGRTPFYVAVSLHDITTAKRAEQMRVDFVANASHELRTPLSSLLGFIETLQGVARGDVAASDRFLRIMHEEAERMVRLIDDLLSLSRIELDRHVQPTGHVALAPVMESVRKSMEQHAAKRGITLVAELPDDLPPLRADPDQVIQVFQNLINNAVKYGREASAIHITARRLDRIPDSGLPGVAITVADQGDGIAPEHLPRLTERFYRVDAARSRRLGGTGLGLAIVKHIVNRHRGSLTIDSTQGEGTQVTVALPVAQNAADGPAAEPRPAAKTDTDRTAPATVGK